MIFLKEVTKNDF